jgi:hypothetical protein
MRASRGPKSMAIAVIGTEFLWLRKPRSLGKWSKTTTIGPEKHVVRDLFGEVQT